MKVKKWNAAQTPDEMAQGMSALADRLEEMDRAEGIFGEAMLDEDLEFVAGGCFPTLPPLGSITYRCNNPKCRRTFSFSPSPMKLQPDTWLCDICMADARFDRELQRYMYK